MARKKICSTSPRPTSPTPSILQARGAVRAALDGEIECVAQRHAQGLEVPRADAQRVQAPLEPPDELPPMPPIDPGAASKSGMPLSRSSQNRIPAPILKSRSE